jgi:hypothetical protein
MIKVAIITILIQVYVYYKHLQKKWHLIKIKQQKKSSCTYYIFKYNMKYVQEYLTNKTKLKKTKY